MDFIEKSNDLNNDHGRQYEFDKELLTPFFENPSMVLNLCRTVIDLLDPGNNNPARNSQEIQLKEISRSINRLKKMNVPVPESLLNEHKHLTDLLAISPDEYELVIEFGDELETILLDLNSRVKRQNIHFGNKTSASKRIKRPKSPRTDRYTLRKHIIHALKKLGGSAESIDVVDQVGKQLNGKFLPGDLEFRKDGKTVVWDNNVRWERYRMTQERLLKTDSPHGIWELTDQAYSYEYDSSSIE